MATISNLEATIVIISADDDPRALPRVISGSKEEIAKIYRDSIGDSDTCVSDDGLTQVSLSGITFNEIDELLPPTYSTYRWSEGDRDLFIGKLTDIGCELVDVEEYRTCSQLSTDAPGYKINYRVIPGLSIQFAVFVGPEGSHGGEKDTRATPWTTSVDLAAVGWGRTADKYPNRDVRTERRMVDKQGNIMIRTKYGWAV